MEFSEYDATWPGEAQRLIDQLRIALSAVLLDIEHIGSTSVPELAAKPIIDVMGSVRRLEDLDGYDEALAGLGITPQETDMTGRLLYCRRGDDRIDVNLHIVTADTWDDRNERILRDHLRGNPAHVRAYADLKRRLAAETDDGDVYVRAKTELVQEMVDAARDARGLPRARVWED